MILTGARVATSATSAERADVEIRGGRVLSLGSSSRRAPQLDLDGHLLLPGLINCHDHLEFSLFPRLGHGPYPSATAWAEDIYRPDQSPVKEHLAVPKAVRLRWGGLKNLLSGVTTVAHHNPYEAEVFESGFPVRVVKQFGWAHSLRFSPDLVDRYRAVPNRRPFLVHAAEGTDPAASSEIGELERRGVLRSRTVLIHGVGVDCGSLDLLRRRRVSLVWCPSSNLFTLSHTLRPEVLRSGIPIGLGTDSSLTCNGDLADEISVARLTGGLSAADIYPMVTTQAARILRLNRGEGEIRENGVADLLAVSDQGQNPSEALRGFCPELVILGGKIQLVSKKLASRIDPVYSRHLHEIALQGLGAWLVNVDVVELRVAAEAILGRCFRLAGRPVRT